MGRRALIDGDMLVYEVASSGQYINEKGEAVVLPFKYVEELLLSKLELILEEAWAEEEEPRIFLTGDKHLHKMVYRTTSPKPPLELNFRIHKAVTQGYKANRKDKEKPFHFNNVRAYMLGMLNAEVAWGMEADDAMCIAQMADPNEETIICSRDKDLRMCPGWHYGWECGNQPAFMPQEISEHGYLKLPKPNKLVGGGNMFFYAQLAMGDSTDNIPGLYRKGPSWCFKNLGECKNEQELWEVISKAYQEYRPDDWREYLKEQADLLWMVRGYDKNGDLDFWRLFDER